MSTYNTLTAEDMETMEKDELMEKITELQDLMNALMTEKSDAPKSWADEPESPVPVASEPVSAPAPKPTEEEYKGPRRESRSVAIEGGRTVFGYVLGHKFSNFNGIRHDVIRELSESGFKPHYNSKNGKTGYGIFIDRNDDDMTLTFWCYYKFGLNRMEEMFLALMREGQERVRNGTLRRREHRPQEHHHTSTYNPDICRYRELRARRAMRNPDVSKNPQNYTYTINGGYRRKHHH